METKISLYGRTGQNNVGTVIKQTNNLDSAVEKAAEQTKDPGKGITQNTTAANVGTYVMVNGKPTFVKKESKTNDCRNKKDDINIKDMNNIGMTASFYSLGGSNYLTKGLSLSSGRMSAMTANKPAVSQGNLRQTEESVISEDQIKEAPWVSSNLIAYQNKISVRNQDNKNTFLASTIYTGTVTERYVSTQKATAGVS